MRSIVNSTFVSLDGVVNHMDKWHFNYVDSETDAFALDQLMASDAMLMGRKTYDVYASAWPNRDGVYAEKINSLPKYVASSSLTEPTWHRTTVLSGDLVESVRNLKAEPGGPILMHGYGPVAKTLLGAGLLDELHLWVHPVLAGAGAAEDLLLHAGLNVVLQPAGQHTFKNGVIVLSYHARNEG
jgi:dihydrofolate reductase